MTITWELDRWDYRVHYTTLDPNIIFNFVGRKISPRLMEVENKKSGFYEKLEKSLLEKGFLNPILIVAGWSHDIDSKIHQDFIRNTLPDRMKEDDKILMCDRNGGSRLYFAQKHNLKVPCIVSDYIGRFSDCKELKSSTDIRECYTYPPKYIKFDSRGVLVLMPHKLTD